MDFMDKMKVAADLDAGIIAQDEFNAKSGLLPTLV